MAAHTLLEAHGQTAARDPSGLGSGTEGSLGAALRAGETPDVQVEGALAEHGGWPGVLHGAVLLALMDEALEWSLYFHGRAGVTARFDARFRRPTPIGATVVVRAWTLERRSRLVSAHAEARLDSDEGPVLAKADASMFIGEQEASP